MKYKILIVTGSRSEYGLFRSTILKLKKSKLLTVKLLVTGMHTLKEFGFTLDSIKKDMQIDYVAKIKESSDMISALNLEIEQIYSYLNKNDIKAVMVVGDRDESFAAAVVSIHLNIPVLHVSGGDISGPTVDNLLRNAISIFSKLHLVQTIKSKKNLIKMGIKSKDIHIVGSAGLDQLDHKDLKPREEMAKKLGLNPDKEWFLISMHPTPFEKTSLSKQIYPLISALKNLSKNNEIIIIYPNSDMGGRLFIKAISGLAFENPTIHIFKNLGREEYLGLLNQSKAIIGNSSSGLMEAGYLKIPFVNVGNRQKGREKGANVISVGYNDQEILKGIKFALSNKFKIKLEKTQSVYHGGDVSGRIVKNVESFIKNYYA